MRIKFLRKGEEREGVLLAEGHQNDSARHTLLVAMVELVNGGWEKLAFVRPGQVIEWIPDEGNGIALLRQKVIAKITEAHKEKSDG